MVKIGRERETVFNTSSYPKRLAGLDKEPKIRTSCVKQSSETCSKQKKMSMFHVDSAIGAGTPLVPFDARVILSLGLE